MSEIDFDAMSEEAWRVEREEGAHEAIRELLIGQHCDAERIAELMRDTTRGYQEPSELMKALIEQHRERYAAAETYTELCEASKDYKRMREEWGQASEDAWMVNLHRVLPRLADE